MTRAICEQGQSNVARAPRGDARAKKARRIYGARDARRAAAVAAIVGTVLVAVNQGGTALTAFDGDLAVLTRVAFNYAVPFLVSSATSVLANRETKA